ncbi:MAG TPA: hypothetical protein PKW33_17275 [Anaerolineaceae bacterium]|nr:hypothetical protein [Anaerolineaceae bacterium]HPN53352.1 hypothetical protein [Anaerolineaceae bacterium]
MRLKLTFNRFLSALQHPAFWVYVIQAMLISAVFLPNLWEMNLWDESAYIYSGYTLLTKGYLTIYAFSPLISMFYALTGLPFLSSPFWLVLSCSLGRFLLFTLLFTGGYLAAASLKRYGSHWAVLGLLAGTPILMEMYNYPTDPLFASMSALGFWQFMTWYHSRKTQNLALASTFLGLSALARNDGLVIFAAMSLAVLVFSWKQPRRWQSWLAAALPFLVLVAGYILLRGAVTGDFNPGTLERTYDNFESGQEIILSSKGEYSATIEAYLAAREAFGTPEENHYSVFNAIQRNPPVYLARMRALLASLPLTAARAYGARFVLLLGVLVLRGVIHLLRQRKGVVLLICLIWLSPLAVGLVNTMIRVGYLRLPYFVLMALASLGAGALLSDLASRRGQVIWGGLLLGLVAFTLWQDALSMLTGLLAAAAGLILLRVFQFRWQGRRLWPALVLLVVLGLGWGLHGPFPGFKWRTLGEAGPEVASAFLYRLLPEDSLVLSGVPGPVWMARMTFAGLNATDVPDFASAGEFLTWMRAQDIKAVYVDPSMSPHFREMVDNLQGNGLELVYTTDQRYYQILLVK